MTRSTASRPESTATSAADLHHLDTLTGGAFTAATSGERAACVRAWLASEPAPELMQQVFKELSVKDKGAAKLLREKLDELRRAKGQEAMAVEWAAKAQVLLGQTRMNIADALAWQRDAAKAGAPLSREPLASVKASLAERVKVIEDLQHRAQVQREAAVLLAQRIEVLSTKSWKDAHTALEVLGADVAHWHVQAAQIVADANWASVDGRFPPLLEASNSQLGIVWSAFQEALTQTLAAANDPAAPLPNVRVWADELRQVRGVAVEPAPESNKPRVDPAVQKDLRDKATQAVQAVLQKVEQEVGEGHGKASAGAAAALRNALREHGRHIDTRLEAKAHAALAAAGELEGWQRWRADQLREELVGKAEGLLKRPEGQAMGGRKMQETLRALREQWKQTDQGGVPNHAMWKRFDEACNEAHKVVEVWLDKLKAEAAEHRVQRLALIDELKAWGAAQLGEGVAQPDWKSVARGLHQFGDRWREAGHLSEKAFAELQPLWKQAMAEAAAPLEAVQKHSLERRHAMIEEAKVLGASPTLQIDAIKAVQQRWQAEAHVAPLDRRHEQKLWDAFRKPIDEAFQRKTQEREKTAAALGAHDRSVMEAAKALQSANASGDATAIRAAMSALDAAVRGQAQAQAAHAATAPAVADAAAAVVPSVVTPAEDAPAVDLAVASEGDAPATAAPVVPAKSTKPVVAMRGDDRPGMKKAEPAAPVRGGRPAPRRDGAGARDGRDGRDSRDSRAQDRFGPPQDRGPRLGDAAFRAQRDAIEHAEMALRKLAAQAHGESLTQLLGAWEHRDAAQVPSVQDLGARVSSGVRAAWVQAVGGAARTDEATLGQTLLRLEMAAEVPTAAKYLDQRRAMQLQLLTRRNDPAPAQTWGLDVGKVLGGAFEAEAARRLQAVLKTLFKR